MRRAPEVSSVQSELPVVLLAEDDDELRRLLARKLRRQGCDVVEARTGTQLVELVVEHTVEPIAPEHRQASLVISDLRMPGRSGLDVLRLLRRANVTVPVILMTAFGSREVHDEAHMLGAAAVFDKPVDLDDLTAAACALLRPGEHAVAP
ncbi:MAG TPA: response regulator [Kofleriaceae bacterium]|nr:response regulator [Kofleriaceae bacterium]